MDWFRKQFLALKRSTSSGKFIPFVDGLRFLAIVPVVLQHASERLLKYNGEVEIISNWEQEAAFLISRGAIGVFIFFTLSGFILSLPFSSNSRNFSYKKYLGRRLTRLEVPYIFWMSLCALVLAFKHALPPEQLTQHWLASLFYYHTILYGEFSVINPVAWSLEVEIQYYLMAPFLAFLYFKQANVQLRRIALLTFVLCFLILQNTMGWQQFPVKASILGHLHQFLLGMFMADLYKNDTDWIEKKHIVWDIIAPISLLLMAYTWSEELSKTLVMNTALLLLFLAALKGRYFPKLLSLKGLTIVGGMCYTIYLIHLPLLELYYSLIVSFGQSTAWWLQLSISLSIALPLLLLSSMIAFRLIEQPFMKRNIWEQIRLRLAEMTSNKFTTQKQQQ